MSNMLRSYRRSILRAKLCGLGAKKVSKKVTFSDKDEHKSRFSRAFREMIYGKKEKAK